MKKILAVSLALIMMFSFAACGGNSNEPADEPQESSDVPGEVISEESSEAVDEVPVSAWLSTKTGKFYSQFTTGKMYMEYETEYEGVASTVKTASSGNRTYSETTSGGITSVSITDGEYMYVIDSANKMIIKMAINASTQEMVKTMITEDDVDPTSIVSGSRDIDGKTYDTEEITFEDGKTILCFDGDDLAYMVGEYSGVEVVMKILAFSDSVDEKLFEIPTDYQVISY